MRNFFIFSVLIVFQLFSNLVNAQNYLSVSEALKDLKNAQIIQFDAKTNQENKLYKKWKSYPQISKVIITDSFDIKKLERLINEIAKNENIDQLCISFGKRDYLPSLSKLTNLTSLKIYNSTPLDQEAIVEVFNTLTQLTEFSWINNSSIFWVDVLAHLPNLKTLELIDTSLSTVLDTRNNILKLKKLESLTLSIPSIAEMDLPVNEFISLPKINLIDIKKYKSEESIPDFLEIENDLSVKFFVVNDKSILVEYFGNTSVLPDKEKIMIQNKLGGKQIIDWQETTYTKTPQSIKPAAPTTTIENDESANFEHKNPAANPPIKTLVLPKTIYTIENSKTTQITRENGTIIDIPADAFVDKNGNEVKGNITVSYKEYLDPLSIFASGIPMTYDSGGVKSTFTSAGMFELYAFSGNEEVQLKPGKNIDVQFASVNDGKNYNFYEFDETKKEWKFEKSNLETTQIDSAKQTSNFNSIIGFNRKTIQFSNSEIKSINFDTTNFESRYNNLNYFNLFDSCRQKGKVYYSGYYDIINGKVKRCNIESYSRTAPSNMFKIAKVSKPDYDSANHVLFTLNNERMLRWFPELKIFYGYVFYSEEFEKYKILYNHYFKNKIYSDVRLEYEKGDDYCTFVLKTPEGFIDFKANILDVNKTKQSHYVYKSFYRRYMYYNKRLTIRQKAFDIHQEWRKTAFRRNSWRRGISPSQFANDTSNYGLATWAKPISAKRRAVLVKTGLYNCDVQFEVVNVSVVDLNLKNGLDSTIKFDKIFLFDDDMNGYITYETKKVMLQPKTTRGIIATTAAGVLYYITKSGLLTKDFGKKEVDIHMNESTETIGSIGDLGRLFRR